MRICTKTVLDDTIKGIRFDENGACHYCKIFEEMEKQHPIESRDAELAEIVAEIKRKGKGKRYDCIIGASGGTDSSYTMLKVKELGLRPLAVHLDNGWNSEIAVKNIKKACDILEIDLYTYVIDWEEFKNLQISFLKSSTPDAEIPTDVAIHSILMRTAAKEGVQFVLNGHSFRTEFIMPKDWTYMDGRYITSVQKIFNGVKLRSFPNYTLLNMIWFNFIRRIKVVPFLNFYDYNKEAARKVLEDKLDWQYYGGHHHENVYTKFYQSYLLPQKFGIDKRKTALSANILSGKMSRDEALKILDTEQHHVDKETVNYVVRKLGLSDEEFEKIMNSPIKSFRDYPTYYPLIKLLRYPILVACKLGILPMLLYYKFLDE